MSALELKQITKSYSGPEGDLPILNGVDLTMERGGAVAVTGPSGCGKSTLLYIIGALEPPTAGELRIDGVNPFALSAHEAARFRNARIGFVFQDHHLLPQCTVLENVLVPTLAGGGGRDGLDRARQLLERVGLWPRRGHLPSQLSGGERQRAALCRALINRPLVVLADEPTGNLDPAQAQNVATLLLELHREQETVLVMVTHSLELASRFPRRAELRQGRLEFADGR